MLKKKVFLILAISIILAVSTSAFALEQQDVTAFAEDHAPVIGEFRYNPEMAKLIKQKEELAFKYYNAVKTNSPMSDIYLEQFKNFNASIKKARSAPLKELTSTSKILWINQVPQETSFWCGYAGMKSLLDYEGISMTQAEIADEVYRQDSACPWYLSHGNDWSQFPVATHLTEWIGFYYIPYPYGPAGTTDVTADDVKPRVISTIDTEHGVMSCGISKGHISGHESILPGYPAREIGHWIVIDGYMNNGDLISIVDPAKSDAVSWSGSISAYYSISANKLAAFTKSKGIIW